MQLSNIIDDYHDAFLARYGDTALPEQFNALNAICSCRTPNAGQIYTACPDCDHTQMHPLSCGNRNCPHCQNHETSQWIDRQQNKLLPVRYSMVTFTLPRKFRVVAYRNQRMVYSLMFVATVSATNRARNCKFPSNVHEEILACFLMVQRYVVAVDP